MGIFAALFLLRYCPYLTVRLLVLLLELYAYLLFPWTRHQYHGFATIIPSHIYQLSSSAYALPVTSIHFFCSAVIRGRQ